MKKILIVLVGSLYSFLISAQSSKYAAAGVEQIFSFSSISDPSFKTIPRYAPLVNFQLQLHRNYGRYFGFYTGIAVRNIGMIYRYRDTNAQTIYKYRSYTVGIPLAFKVGNVLRKSFFYGGAEIEASVAYKRKIVNNRHKEIYHEWFSDQVASWLPSVFLGFQTRGGFNLKFKYYLNNVFYLPSSATDASLQNRIYYISLTKLFNLKKKKNSDEKPDEKQAIIKEL